MLRTLVLRVVAPIYRWAIRGRVLSLGIGRDEDGTYIGVDFPGGVGHDFTFDVDEARSWGQRMCRLARDQQEGAPLEPLQGTPDGKA